MRSFNRIGELVSVKWESSGVQYDRQGVVESLQPFCVRFDEGDKLIINNTQGWDIRHIVPKRPQEKEEEKVTVSELKEKKKKTTTTTNPFSEVSEFLKKKREI